MSRSTNPAAFELDTFLPYRLDAVASRVSEALFDVYGERHDLRVPDWRVLVWLDQEPEIAAKDIAVRARMDKATVSRALTRLESLDLVARKVAPGDQRSQALLLTRRGKALLARLLPEVQRWEQTVLAPFSSTERRQLMSLLERLDAHLEEAPTPAKAGTRTTAAKAAPSAGPGTKKAKGGTKKAKAAKAKGGTKKGKAPARARKS